MLAPPATGKVKKTWFKSSVVMKALVCSQLYNMNVLISFMKPAFR